MRQRAHGAIGCAASKARVFRALSCSQVKSAAEQRCFNSQAQCLQSRINHPPNRQLADCSAFERL